MMPHESLLLTAVSSTTVQLQPNLLGSTYVGTDVDILVKDLFSSLACLKDYYTYYEQFSTLFWRVADFLQQFDTRLRAKLCFDWEHCTTRYG